MPDFGNFIKVIQTGTGGGPYSVATDTPSAGQTTVTNTSNGEFFVLPAPTAEVTGQFAGTGTTFAGLPTTDALGDAVSNGDFAILTADDGANLSGVYVYDGAAYNFVYELPDTFQAVVPAVQADVTSGTVQADAYVQADTLKVELDKKADINPVADAAALTTLAGTLAAGDAGTVTAFQEDTNQFFIWNGTAFQEAGGGDNFVNTDLVSTEPRQHDFDDVLQIVGEGQKDIVSNDNAGRVGFFRVNQGVAELYATNTNGAQNSTSGLTVSNSNGASSIVELTAQDPATGGITGVTMNGERVRIFTPEVDAGNMAVGQVLKSIATNGSVEYANIEYFQDFVIADWTADGIGGASISVPEATHETSTIPVVEVCTDTGVKVETDISFDTSTGDVTITILEEEAFDGKIIIK